MVEFILLRLYKDALRGGLAKFPHFLVVIAFVVDGDGDDEEVDMGASEDLLQLWVLSDAPAVFPVRDAHDKLAVLKILFPLTYFQSLYYPII